MEVAVQKTFVGIQCLHILRVTDTTVCIQRTRN